jgi:hypothetical protein
MKTGLKETKHIIKKIVVNKYWQKCQQGVLAAGYFPRIIRRSKHE